jgi:hypothetical protein
MVDAGSHRAGPAPGAHRRRPQQRLLRRVAAVAACAGHRDIVAWLHERYGLPLDCWGAAAAAAAAARGDVAWLAWLHERRCPWDESASVAAAKAGHLHALRFLQRAGAAAGGSAISPMCGPVAAAQGHLHVLEWLLHEAPEVAGSHGRALWRECARACARGGHLGVLQWLVHTFPRWPGCDGPRAAACPAGVVEEAQGLLRDALLAAHLDVVEWLLAMAPPPVSPPRSAAGPLPRGSVPPALVLAAARVDADALGFAWRAAAERGALDMLRWLWDGALAPDGAAAAEAGAHARARAAFARALRHTPAALPLAARKGHTDVLQWLLDEPRLRHISAAVPAAEMEEWVDQSVTLAATFGRLDALQTIFCRLRLRERPYWGRCGIDYVCRLAIARHHAHIVRWALSCGARWAGPALAMRAHGPADRPLCPPVTDSCRHCTVLVPAAASVVTAAVDAGAGAGADIDAGVSAGASADTAGIGASVGTSAGADARVCAMGYI